MAAELDSQEESTEDTELEEVETEQSEDESTDEQASEESQDEETSEEDESDDSANAFDKRFTQFKGDTPEEYIKNLEEGYANSTAEYAKLKKQAAEYQAPTDQPTTDPALLYARQQMEEKQGQEFEAFAKDHSEIETDPEVKEKMLTRLTTLSKTVLAEEGRILGMAEGLSMAWASLGLGNNQQENTRMAAKDAAATSKTASAKKNVSKAQFTQQQLEVAKKMGLTEKDLLAQTAQTK